MKLVTTRGYSRAVRRYAPYMVPGQYRAAARVAAGLYRNRRTVKRAARTIGRAYRSYKRRKTTPTATRVQGQKKGTSYLTDFVFGADDNIFLFNRKTLLFNPIEFAKNPGFISENTWDRDVATSQNIRVSGVKLCYTITNTNTSTPIRVHMALLQEKSNCDPEFAPTEKFFRSSGKALNQDFVSLTTDPAWSFDQDCLAINSSRFNIIAHKRFILDPRTDAYQSKRPSYRHSEQYFKVNKIFSFAQPNSANVQRPINVAVWYETTRPTTGTDFGVEIVMRSKAYFHNI